MCNFMKRLDALRHEYDNVSRIIKEYFEIDETSLLKSNKECAVDARYVLISILCETHNDNDIAVVSKLSKSVVNKIRNQVLTKQRSNYFYDVLKTIKSLVI